MCAVSNPAHAPISHQQQYTRRGAGGEDTMSFGSMSLVKHFCSDSLGTIVYTIAPSSPAASAQVLTTLSWMHELARKCFCVSYWLSAAPPRHCPLCRNTLLEALNTFYTVAEAPPAPPPAPLPPTSASPGKYISEAVTTHLCRYMAQNHTNQSGNFFNVYKWAIFLFYLSLFPCHVMMVF